VTNAFIPRGEKTEENKYLEETEIEGKIWKRISNKEGEILETEFF
jgi:hypothetical protein